MPAHLIAKGDQQYTGAERMLDAYVELARQQLADGYSPLATWVCAVDGMVDGRSHDEVGEEAALLMAIVAAAAVRLAVARSGGQDD